MFIWSLNAEPWTCSVWMDELHVALELFSLVLNLIVMNMEFYEVKKTLWIEKSQIYSWPAHKKWHLMQKCLLYLIKWCRKPTAKYSKTFYTRRWKCHSPRLLHKQHLCNIDESTFSTNPGIDCATWNTPMILAISSSAFLIGSHC